MLRPEGDPGNKGVINNENKADEGGLPDDVKAFRREFMRILRDLHFNFEEHPERGRKWQVNGRSFSLDRLKNLFSICNFDDYDNIAAVADVKLGWDTFDKCMENCDYIDSLRKSDADNDNSNNYRSRSPSPRRKNHNVSRGDKNHNRHRSRSRSRDRGRNLKSTREQVLFQSVFYLLLLICFVLSHL